MRRIISFLLILMAIATNARQISPNEAQSIAAEFFGTSNDPKHVSPKSIKRVAPKDATADYQPYYIFNAADNAGFVIISGDDRARKILGYSDKGEFDFNNLPPQLDWLLNEYGKQVESIPASASQDPSWQSTDTPAAGEGVLLETANWGQGAPYNAQCPIIDGVQAPTGCVATAMAIVMKYHNWPEQYNWDAMPMSDVTAENSSETGKLMADAGKAVFMNYGPYGSGANMNWVGHKLQQDFTFSPDCQYITAQNFSNDEWIGMLRSNIDNGQPVIYSGTDKSRFVSHAFIVDGYNSTGYHINWGWEGICNGYYALDALRPGENGDYSSDSGMVINITPDRTGKTYSKCFTDYGYFYWVQGDLGESMNLSVEDVRKGEPFHVINTNFTLPAGFSGLFGVALVDKDGVIKEVLRTNAYDTWSDENNQYEMIGTGQSYFNLMTKQEVASTDRIQLVSKDYSEPDYKLVLGTIEWPSWVSVTDNTPRYGKVTWNIDENIHAQMWIDEIPDYEYQDIPAGISENQVLRGSALDMRFTAKGNESEGTIYLQIKGPQLFGDNKITDNEIHTMVSIVGEYEISAEWIKFTDETVTLTTAGALKDKISIEKAKTVKTLTISGKMNAIDFWYIRDNFPALTQLDIGNVEVEEVMASDNRFLGTTESVQPANAIPIFALTGLSKLESVTLPVSTTALMSNSLSSMNLRLIEIPAGVEYIDSRVFYNNENLESVGLLNPEPITVYDDIFLNTFCPSQGTLYVPEGSLDKFRSAEVWREFQNIREGRMSTIIKHDVEIDGLIYECIGDKANLTGYIGEPIDVVIPETICVDNTNFTVTSIKELCFLGCSSLKSVIMPSSITNMGSSNMYIGSDVFASCYNLQSIKLSDNLKRIPARTFINCHELKEIELPMSLEYIGASAFSGAGLLDIYIPQYAKPEIYESAFDGFTCRNGYKVHPENPYYKSVDGVLYRTTNNEIRLEAVPYSKTGTLEVVDNCTSVSPSAILSSDLTSIVFNESLSLIKQSAIERSSDLVHIVLPPNAKIEPGAIWDCQNLESITITGKGRSYYEIINGCEKLNRIYITNCEGIADIDGAFVDCASAVNIYSQGINPSVNYSAESVMYVPSEASINYTNFSNVTEMWSYDIDRTHNLIKIEPAIEGIEITSVLVNGEIVTPKSDCYYEITPSDNLDVVVNYTLHNRQAMTTHYDAEFNAQIPDTELSLPISVSSIEITPASVKDVVGAECQLTATVMPEDATNKTVEWSCDNTEVATVDANGLVRLLAQGSATITATAADGSGVQAQCSVIVDTPTGIEDVLIDADTNVKIYSTTGVLLFEGRYSDAKLDEGIYIVVTPDKQFKRLIK